MIVFQWINMETFLISKQLNDLTFSNMAQYIIEIFKHYFAIVMSWGFHDAIAIENGLRFSVQGFLFTGKVEVVYSESDDLFTIRLLNPNGSTKKKVEGVYLDGLVDTIDSLVEKCKNYKDRVRHEYHLV